MLRFILAELRRAGYPVHSAKDLNELITIFKKAYSDIEDIDYNQLLILENHRIKFNEGLEKYRFICELVTHGKLKNLEHLFFTKRHLLKAIRNSSLYKREEQQEELLGFYILKMRQALLSGHLKGLREFTHVNDIFNTSDILEAIKNGHLPDLIHFEPSEVMNETQADKLFQLVLENKLKLKFFNIDVNWLCNFSELFCGSKTLSKLFVAIEKKHFTSCEIFRITSINDDLKKEIYHAMKKYVLLQLIPPKDYRTNHLLTLLNR
jgi:hypothetical protein